MSDVFDSHRSIIDAWPTLSDFAADAGATYGAAKAMRRRDRIVHEYVSNIVKGAQARGIVGVTADLIADLAAKEIEEKAAS
ncbi:hypothetical protein J4G48_0031955 [Bradyrhizobium barranii subsp. apii]|uniref:hypothetical protein n=1 Tax=Bradyrhizobium barranii TaxID=2992140 RepID=UPI001AA18960|nr:hypothetical protein [Bradyrhizobium barranii]UPT93926.1 hypothetical protein J4G48_0031955 [Bradyrhizobium barranii subsp. apii]